LTTLDDSPSVVEHVTPMSGSTTKHRLESSASPPTAALVTTTLTNEVCRAMNVCHTCLLPIDLADSDQQWSCVKCGTRVHPECSSITGAILTLSVDKLACYCSFGCAHTLRTPAEWAKWARYLD
jgi:hypothetical protein